MALSGLAVEWRSIVKISETSLRVIQARLQYWLQSNLRLLNDESFGHGCHMHRNQNRPFTSNSLDDALSGSEDVSPDYASNSFY